MAEQFEQITVATESGICTITMNRPEKLNAWTPHMGWEMQQAIKAANDDPEVEGIIITGAGRGFCAGADIEAVFKARSDRGGDEADRPSMDNWVTMLRTCKPIVAAINGAAVGVGLTQILPADQLIAARSAKLSMRFIKMGLVPELASSQFLTLRCGFGTASELMLTGRTLMAEEAQSIGLVDQVVDDDQLLDAARSCVQAMGENPQAAIRLVKELMTQNATETDIDLVMRREGQALLACYESAEHKEAIAAFMEKRQPDFKAVRRAQ